jgi:hypothetical protein
MNACFAFGSVLACACGDAHPVPGWAALAGKTTYFIHCCACGVTVEAETEVDVAVIWNARARKVQGVAA